MSNLAQFVGSAVLRPPTSLVNAQSVASFAFQGSASVFNAASKIGRATLSGALTAATLKTMLTITGAGVLNFIGVQTADATSRTVRVKITIDGNVVLDATSAAVTTTGTGAAFIGFATPNSTLPISIDQVPFHTSALVEMASSLTETDKLTFFDAYRISYP